MPQETAELPDLRPPPDDGAIAAALGELESKLSTWFSSADAICRQLGRRSAQAAEFESALAGQRQSLDRQIEEFKGEREQLTRERDEIAARHAAVDASAVDDAGTETAFVAPPHAPERSSKKHSQPQPAIDDAPVRPAEADGGGRTARGGLPASGRPEAGQSTSADGEEGIPAPEPIRSPQEEDAALLDSLDNAVATMIRRRHQACGGRRSIKELIAEHEREMDEAEALLDSLPTEVAADIRVQFRFYNGRKTIKQLIEEYKSEPGSEKHSWWKRVKG